MSTQLSELDIVFIWFELKGEGLPRSTHMFNNNASKQEVESFLKSLHPNKEVINIQIER